MNAWLAWTEQLPKQWKAVPLRAAADFTVSSVDKIPADDELPVRLANYTDVYKNEFISPDMELMRTTATANEIEKFRLRRDDVIITKDSEEWDDIGIPALVVDSAEDLVCGYHLAILRPDQSKLDGRFLFRCLQAKDIRIQLELAADGVTRFGIPKDAIGKLQLPIPPSVTEQRAIAGYLDRETGRLDALVSAKERWLELLAEKRRALITRAVTRGLNPAAPLRDSGLPWLGQIPENWQVIRLKFACESLQTGPFGSQLHAEDYVLNGTPVINPAHLIDGRIIPDDTVAVDGDTVARLAIHRLEPGDIVFARRGELGRCGLVTEKESGWLCGTGSLRARPYKNRIHSEYVLDVMANTPAAEMLLLESVGTTMDNLNTEILGDLSIPSPPLEEQLSIVAYIGSATAKLDGLRAAAEQTIALLKERRAALIAAAVTGKLSIN